MKAKPNPLLRPAVLAAAAFAFAGAAIQAQAQTTYRWNGSPTASSDWTTAANWASPGIGATGGTSNSRLNVYNGSGAPLIYFAAQGTTVYSSSGRGLVIGNAGINAGSMEITGGSFSTLGSASSDVIGNFVNGTLTVSGGIFIGAGTSAGGTIVGLNSSGGTSTFTVTGTGSAVLTTLQLSGATSIVNLEAGTLTANRISDADNVGTTGNSNTTFNFNGGTLVAGASDTAFMTGLTQAYVLSGSAKINTNGQNITIDQALLAPVSGTSGGLTKSGSGTLALTGANTYTGNTTVNEGTLELGASSQLQFVVTDAPAANLVGGSGSAVFNGSFNIDTSAVAGTTGYIWLLVDRANLSGESFGTSFSVSGFTDPEDDGTWTMTDSKGDWTFSEASGELALDATSDYDAWKSANGVTGGEADDDDSDGLTNQEEYAFGLAPNSGSSVNPILAQLDHSTGTFTYQRRKPSLTGLTSYKILTSTDLATWTEDATAGQVATAIPATDNESVVVTLTTPPTAAKFFVRVSAN